MNTSRADWRSDLEHSRDLTLREVESYGFFISWFDGWRVGKALPLDREAAVRFWKEVVKIKERERWLEDQWAEAMRWFLNWVTICQRAGKEYKSLGERLKNAVHEAGARRGLSLNTRRTYAGWIARYGAAINDEHAVMEEAQARRWLGELVTKTQVSFATQKQALNALVFFFKDVCGRAEVDLGVKMRKRGRHIPVVLSKSEVLRLIKKIEPKYRLKAQLQYGAGLRLRELVSLRVKDIDLERGTLVVRAGKGDKDRVTIIPETLKDDLREQLRTCREIYNIDRMNDAKGVAMPNALERKMPKANTSWECRYGATATASYRLASTRPRVH